VATIKPIFLLADSQLLFWRERRELPGEQGEEQTEEQTAEQESPFLERVRGLLDEEAPLPDPKAAYLGASNGDAPEFFDLFEAAMAGIGIRNCRHIPSDPQDADIEFLKEADLILLAGGDVGRGWRVFERTGIKDRLVERYYAGALLMGVSAGAVQLGLKGWDEASERLIDTLRLVPFVVDVHDEPSWSRLLKAVPKAGEHARGFGIPSGGGALYHPDYSVEPVRHPLTEVALGEEGQARQALLLPGEHEPVPPAEPSELTKELLSGGLEGTREVDLGVDAEPGPGQAEIEKPEPEPVN